jgi:hypothetical protein
MSTSAPANSLSFRVIENVTFAKDFDQFLLQFTDIYQKLAKSTNAKDIGDYETVELLNGQQFYGPNPQTKIQIYRKCFALGAVAAGATSSFAHGITLTQLTRVYGTCITAVVDYRPIPYASTTIVTDQIQLTVTATNIVIVNGVTAPNITSGIIVMEYQKN